MGAEPRPESASEAWRAAVTAARPADREAGPRSSGRSLAERAAWDPDDPRPVRAEARRAVSRGQGDGRPRRKAPADVAGELVKAVGPAQAARVEERLMEAARIFSRERYRDALRILRGLAEEAPGAPAVRELHGLTLYRLGRWRDAVRELEAFRALTGSYEQHPVLADCRRALGQHRQVERLWEELRTASPGAELVVEGRVVMAGSKADRGDVGSAIRLLERGPVRASRPRLYHLRLWYALADLYEQAGDVPKARDLFRRVMTHEPGFADVAERLGSLD